MGSAQEEADITAGDANAPAIRLAVYRTHRRLHPLNADAPSCARELYERDERSGHWPTPPNDDEDCTACYRQYD